jgi:hypothetical protein
MFGSPQLQHGPCDLNVDTAAVILCHDVLVAAMSKPTANWEKVGDKFYRKVQLYTAVFDQDLELDKYKAAGAPYSGAVGGYATTTYWRRSAESRSNLP